ncbi:MAG: MBL fold metallo-hydrolase [Bryobacteraceae bacterium]
MDADQARLIALNVGHGNCTVLVDRSGVFLFDAGPSDQVMTFLERHLEDHGDQVRVRALFLSHCHFDHNARARVMSLVAQFNIEYVGMPAFHNKSRKFRAMMRDLSRWKKAGFQLNTVLHCDSKIPQPKETLIEVLGPGARTAGQTSQLNDHDRCAVFRISTRKPRQPIALIGGDISARGWSEIPPAERQREVPLLIYPHHGGRQGTDDTRQTAAQYSADLRPKHVFFSIGSGKKEFPHWETIAGLRSQDPQIQIHCSGINRHCCPEIDTRLRSCCYPQEGNFEFYFPGSAMTEGEFRKHFSEHRDEVDKLKNTAMCRGNEPPPAKSRK